MEQAQHVRQHEINHGQRVRLARRVITKEHRLARLDIPSQYSLQKSGRRAVASLNLYSANAVGDFLDGPVQLQQNPLSSLVSNWGFDLPAPRRPH